MPLRLCTRLRLCFQLIFLAFLLCTCGSSNPTARPPPSASYTPDSLCPHSVVPGPLSLRKVGVFASETSHALGPQSTLPTETSGLPDISDGQSTSVARATHLPYRSRFPPLWETPPYPGPPTREPQSYFHLTTVFLPPHIQSATNRCHFFFLANIS